MSKIIRTLARECVENTVPEIPGISELKDCDVKQEEDGLHITVKLIVTFGTKIPDVAWNVQTLTRDKVKLATGIHVNPWMCLFTA